LAHFRVEYGVHVSGLRDTEMQKGDRINRVKLTKVVANFLPYFID